MGVYFETAGMTNARARPGGDWLGDLGVQGYPLLLSRGRDCLRVIAKLMDLRHGDEILLPAFICDAVLRAVRGWGLTVSLYDINRDLTIEPDKIKTRITTATKAIMYVNYFGMAQPPEAVEQVAGYGLPTIEDSCQSPFALGRQGSAPDFAFTSLRKYAPVTDGAVLDIIAPRWRAAAEERAHSLPTHPRLVFWRALALRARRSQERRDRESLRLVAAELFSHAERALRGAGTPRRMHPLSIRIARRLDIGQVRRRRRANYEVLAPALRRSSIVEPVKPDIPDEACPYGCPVLTANHRLLRDALGHQGIQSAILWEMAHQGDAWPVSTWLSRRILVLPVAQTNTEDDMRRTVEVLLGYDGD